MNQALTIAGVRAMLRQARPVMPPTVRYVLCSAHYEDRDNILLIDRERLRTPGYTPPRLFDAIASPWSMIKLARALRAHHMPPPRRLWKRYSIALYELP